MDHLSGDRNRIRMEQNDISPGAGVVLIAHPWLSDPNFQRTVIFLCEHQDEGGSFGLVLTRPLDRRLGEFIETLSTSKFLLYSGGPVQPETLHFLHRHGRLVDSAIEVQEGLYWGGDFDLVQALVLAGDAKEETTRFFSGYSGWGPGQLLGEIEEGSWILTRAPTEVILLTSPEELWRSLLKRMGGPFALLANFPTDPRNN
ncbi:MAG TPA: YqgE/AlgH family protein [Rhodothermia bacterium]